MVGRSFGRLRVIAPALKVGASKALRWRCECLCGKVTDVEGRRLRDGRVQSCGCLHADTKPNLIHGGGKTRLFRIRTGMLTRCTNTNSKDYVRYGGRGIRVCDEWTTDFAAFRDWALANGYAPSLQIDRIDNDGHYEPGNCRWVTPAMNVRNRRNIKLSADAVSEIRKLAASGVTFEALARNFGVSPSNVGMVCSGKTWREEER
jgi:hypothetical protein